MKQEQNNIQTQAALLRSTNRVDAPVKNSLCCIAAGIIAPSTATADVLIPHEKLREAATPDATLITQNRPPAQPVLGYKPLLFAYTGNRFLLQILRTGVVGNPRQRCSGPVETCNCSPSIRESIATIFKFLNIALSEITGSRKVFFHTFSSIQSFRNLFLDYENRAKDVCWKRSTQEAPQRVPHLFQSSQTNHVGRTSCESCCLIDRGICLIRSIFCEMKSIDFKLSRLLSFSLSLQLMRTLSNQESAHDCSYRTKSLHPCRRVLLCIKSLEQYKQCPPQSTDSHKQPHHPNRGHAHDQWKPQPFHTPRPFAIRRAVRLPAFIAAVHGGLA